jgi:hypothetical protein
MLRAWVEGLVANHGIGVQNILPILKHMMEPYNERIISTSSSAGAAATQSGCEVGLVHQYN